MSHPSISVQELGVSFAEYSQRLAECGTPLSALREALPKVAYHTDRSEAVVRIALRRLLQGACNLQQFLQHHYPLDFLSNALAASHHLDRVAAAERIYNTQLIGCTGFFAAAYQEQVSDTGPIATTYDALMQHMRCLKTARDNYVGQFNDLRRQLGAVP